MKITSPSVELYTLLEEQEYILDISRIVFIYLQALRFKKIVNYKGLTQEEYYKAILRCLNE